MVANNGRYYLIGNYDKYDNISHYRMNRITGVRILEEKRKSQRELPEKNCIIDFPKHMAEHIYMFSRESVWIELVTTEDMMNELIDWFSRGIVILNHNRDGKIKAGVQCNEDAAFFWTLQHGSYVEVMEPKRLRIRVTEAVRGMYDKYTCGKSNLVL